MTPTRHHVLSVAAEEIGYHESPAGSNRTKYGRWYGMDGSPWCAMFVSWVAATAGAAGIIPKHAYTPSGASWFKSQGRWHRTPKSGDIAYFDFPGDGVDRISHVGFVEKVRDDGTLVTIEGNTSNGDNRNGGEVMRRVRNPKYVIGYGRPAYKPVMRAYPGHVIKPNHKHAGEVKWVQARLTRHGFKVAIDGDFGPATAKAVKAFKKSVGYQPTPAIGRKTWDKLAAKA